MNKGVSMAGRGEIERMVPMLSDEVEGMGYRYWGGEFIRRGKRVTLRVYIDSDAGVTLDDCAKVSQRLSASLDLHDPIAGSYDLEVSSPGVERPLLEPEHYRSYEGHAVKLRCFSPIEGRRVFTGRLEGVRDEGVDINVDGEVRRIDFSNVRNASLIYEGENASPLRNKEVEASG